MIFDGLVILAPPATLDPSALHPRFSPGLPYLGKTIPTLAVYTQTVRITFALLLVYKNVRRVISCLLLVKKRSILLVGSIHMPK
jgi:hypothetical protein